MKDWTDTSRIVRFGRFEIDREACELRRDGHRVPLQIQPFRVLEALIERHGDVVTRADLCAKIWPSNIFVDFDHGLNSAMTRLRHALGDSGEAPVYIETLPRIGYRFIHAIEQEVEPAGSAASNSPRLNRTTARPMALAALVLIGLLGSVVWQLVRGDAENTVAELRASSRTPSPDARDAYLRGLDFFEQRNKEAIAQSIVQLTRATEADPGFAAAHAALAMAYVSAGGNNSLARYLSPSEALAPALAAADRALRLDPALAEAHWALAGVLNGLQPWSPATDVAIEQAYRRAVELDSGIATVQLSFGNFLSTRSRSAEAIAHYREAVKLDPISPSINSRLGIELVGIGQAAEGLAYLRKTVELDPWQFNAQWRLGWAYITLEDLDAAERAFQAAEQISPGSVRSRASLAFVAARKGDDERARALLASLHPQAEGLDDPTDIAIVYVGLRDQENSIAWLSKAASQTRTLHMQGPWGIGAPMYDWLRGDPRFVEIESEIQATNGRTTLSDVVL